MDWLGHDASMGLGGTGARREGGIYIRLFSRVALPVSGHCLGRAGPGWLGLVSPYTCW